MRHALIIVVLAAACCPLNLFAKEWPQWRGPNRDGISKEKGLLQEWPEEGPKLLWQQSGLGDGFSTPSIAGGRIFLINNTGLDDEYVQALELKDGTPIWKTKLGKVGNPDQGPSYPGARSTPTVDGDMVYALGSDGDLICAEAATGKEKWRKSLRDDFGGKPGTWAYAESPLIDGNVLVVAPGGKEATIVALNKTDGAVIWKSPSQIPDGEAAGYASAIVINAAGIKQYVEFLQKGLVGVEAKTGKTLWRYDHTATGAAATIATPVYSDDHIYSGTNYTGGGLAKLTREGDEMKAEEIYYSKKDLPIAIGGAVLVGDHLYGTNKEQTLCVDFKTGEVKWQEPRKLAPGSVLFADGRIYLHGQEKGDLALLEATTDGYQERGHFTPPDVPPKHAGKAWEYPVIADGKLYLHDWGTLWCYDIKASRGRRAASRTTSVTTPAQK